MNNKVNLKVYNQLKQDDRIDAMLADYDAYDPTTGAYMRGSHGRRKPGKPRKYWASYLNITIALTAHTVEQATDTANRKLNAEYQRIYEASAR